MSLAIYEEIQPVPFFPVQFIIRGERNSSIVGIQATPGHWSICYVFHVNIDLDNYSFLIEEERKGI